MVFAIPVSSPRKIYFNEIYSSRKFSRVKRYLSNISGKIDHFYFQGSLRNDKRKKKSTNSKSHRITEISRFFEIIITIEHISNNYPRIVGIIFLDNIEQRYFPPLTIHQVPSIEHLFRAHHFTIQFISFPPSQFVR